MHRILIVEDDVSFRLEVVRSLIGEGYVVVEAENGRKAVELFEKSKFDMIISDVRMPEMSGTVLLRHIRKTSNIPFVIMTGFSDIFEAQQAYDIGATGFIPKPFKLADFKDMLKLSLPSNDNQKQGTTESEEDYCKINIDDFLSSRKTTVDLYVRLSVTKFVKIAHKNSPLDMQQIEVYKKKGLEYLYIRRTDYGDYVDFNVKVSIRAAGKKEILAPLRLNILKHAEEVMLQDIFMNGLDQKRVADSAVVVKSMLSVVTEDEDILTLLDLLNSHADHLYAHSIAVSIYSVLIAREIGWTTTPTLFKLSLGGLLHDIGKKEIDRKLLEKPRHLLTKDEASILESHCFRGKEILSAAPAISSDVVSIASQHHENAFGQGPFRLKGRAIHPMACVVAIANKFCELVIKSPNKEVKAPHEALEHLITYHANEFEPTAFAALLTVVKYSNDVAQHP